MTEPVFVIICLDEPEPRAHLTHMPGTRLFCGHVPTGMLQLQSDPTGADVCVECDRIARLPWSAP